MLSNKQKIKAIDSWQKDIRMHPMTCGRVSHHPPLSGDIKDGEVILTCNVCSYTQKVPNIVYLAAEQGDLSNVCSMDGCNTKLTRDNSGIWIADVKVGSETKKTLARVCSKCHRELKSGGTNAFSMGCTYKG